MLMLVLIVAQVAVAPRAMVDPDSLSHLAYGRLIAQAGALPKNDPFTFSRPDARGEYPEWLGDLSWYWLWQSGGEKTMHLARAAAVGAGLLLTVRFATKLGGGSVIAALLLLMTLPGSAARFTFRNDIHLYWLVPACGLIALAAQRRTWCWLALVPLGWLWANTHASFVLGWLVIAAMMWHSRQSSTPIAWRWALPVLILQPLLPLLGPAGAASYQQLWDHLWHGDIYRQLITEWKSPVYSSGVLAVMPLHLGVVLLLWSGAELKDRKWVPLWSMMAVGLVMAHLSRRFLPVLAVLCVPPAAVYLTSRSAAFRPKLRRAGAAILATILLLYVGLSARAAIRHQRPAVLDTANSSRRTAEFIASHAPDGTRVFNSFNAGPWLVWFSAPRVKHYVDPRNTLGGDFLTHYAAVARDAALFAEEAKQLDIGLALLSLEDGALTSLVNHLDASPDWAPVYLDGHHAVYARRRPENAILLQRFGYGVLRGRLTTRSLADEDRRVAAMIDRDLSLLSAQAAELGRLAVLCRRLLAGSGAADEASVAERILLAPAIRSLPPSGLLASCYATSLWAAGREDRARRVVSEGRRMIPKDATLTALHQRGWPNRR